MFLPSGRSRFTNPGCEPLFQIEPWTGAKQAHILVVHRVGTEVFFYFSIGWGLEGDLPDYQLGIALFHYPPELGLKEYLQEVGPAHDKYVGLFFAYDVRQCGISAFAVEHLFLLCREVL